MSEAGVVLDNKSFGKFYNFKEIQDVVKYDDKREKRFCNLFYKYGGFVFYPLLKNTKILKIIHSIVSYIFKSAHTIVGHDKAKAEKILKRIGIVREYDIKKVTASDTNQKDGLKGIGIVVQDIQSLYTTFKPSRTQTEPSGPQAGDAKLIKRLDSLGQNVESDFKSKKVKDLKNTTLSAIDQAIVEVTKSALGREERAKLFKMCRAGKISKRSRDVLGDVMYRQYYSTTVVGADSPWIMGSNPVDKEKLNPADFLEPPLSPLRTKKEICQDVIDKVDELLKTETDSKVIKMLQNIKKRHEGHLKKLEKKQKKKKEDDVSEHSSTSIRDAKNIIACADFEAEIKGKDIQQYVKEAICWIDYNRYLSKQVKIGELLDEEGKSLYKCFKNVNDLGLIKDTCAQLQIPLKVVMQEGYQLTAEDIEEIRKELLKKVFYDHYKPMEYESLFFNMNQQRLDEQGVKKAFERYISEKLAPPGWDDWLHKNEQEKKSELEQAEDIVEDLSDVRIPALYHATGSAETFLSIANTEVRVLAAIMGTGAFASTVPEIPTYGKWCFAFQEEDTAWNSTPVNAFTKPHNAIWAGYSKPFPVPLKNKLGKVVSMLVAYVIVDDDDLNREEEWEEQNQQQTLFDQIGIIVGNMFNLSSGDDHTVKGVRKLLKDNGFRNVVVVSKQEAILERNLIYGKHWCQHPWWEPGYGPSTDFSMNQGPYQHPINYK